MRKICTAGAKQTRILRFKLSKVHASLAGHVKRNWCATFSGNMPRTVSAADSK